MKNNFIVVFWKALDTNYKITESKIECTIKTIDVTWRRHTKSDLLVNRLFKILNFRKKHFFQKCFVFEIFQRFGTFYSPYITYL